MSDKNVFALLEQLRLEFLAVYVEIERLQNANSNDGNDCNSSEHLKTDTPPETPHDSSKNSNRLVRFDETNTEVADSKPQMNQSLNRVSVSSTNTIESFDELACITRTQSDNPSDPVRSRRRSTFEAQMIQLSHDKQYAKIWDKDGSLRERLRGHAKHIIDQGWFDASMGIIIMANSACLGIESELRGESPAWLYVLEQIFLTIYLVELILNLLGRGRQAFRDTWFQFDFMLVVTSCCYSWIIDGLLVRVFQKDSESTGIGIQQVLVFRLLRLLRLLRALRLVPLFKTAWHLTYGLLTSTNTMLSTVALLILVLYLFACLGIELITHDVDLKDDELIIERFGSIMTIMLTLVQFVTMDSIADLYYPLITKKPLLAFYFLTLILVISVALMNLVTAVLVERAQENSANDKEDRQRIIEARMYKAVPELKRMFREVDTDNSGDITVHELKNIIKGGLEKVLDVDFMQAGHIDSMKELFEVLDIDSSGTLDENEFIDGLMTLALAEFKRTPSAESILLLRLMRAARKSDRRLHKTMTKLSTEFEFVKSLAYSQAWAAGIHRKNAPLHL